MTLNKQKLIRLGESWWIMFTKEQELLILERFGEEPWPYEWSEQDICEQIRHIVRDNPAPPKPLPVFLK
jgi:hypothetical protein